MDLLLLRKELKHKRACILLCRVDGVSFGICKGDVLALERRLGCYIP